MRTLLYLAVFTLGGLSLATLATSETLGPAMGHMALDPIRM